MKNLILTLVFASIEVTFLSISSAAAPVYPVHVLPDQRVNAQDLLTLRDDQPLSSFISEALRVGKKNMDWLIHMNSLRPNDQKIALTKPGELTPIPIDKPKVYSPETIERNFKELSIEVPESMNHIIFGDEAFTDNPEVDLATYILWAKKVDKMYQTASRWETLLPYMSWYKVNKQNDIRGYYFLSREENLTEKLTGFTTLSQEDKDRLTPLLINVCENTKGVNLGCDGALQKSISKNQVNEFYLSYYKKSKEIFDSAFQIQGTRPELTWTSADPNFAMIPIRDTKNENVNHFLKYNIEDEWKWNDWSLNLNFTSNADIHVEFVAGDTPHVNGIAGNTITMDGNAPLTEWDVQWTIRHEFGHVLGFPDCYVEFYDNNLKAMVNYQIDIENLMCSRAGKMQELHYSEMKKNYFH